MGRLEGVALAAGTGENQQGLPGSGEHRAATTSACHVSIQCSTVRTVYYAF